MLKQLLGVLGGFFLGLFCYYLSHLYLYQEQLLFKNKPLKENHVFRAHDPYEEIFVHNEEGKPLHALLYRSPDSKGLILYFHGRGSNLSDNWQAIIREFLSRSHDVLIMDYRGFGKSRGKLSEKALLSDALLVYDYAAQHYVPEGIVIYGRSLGTGIATYVASKRPAPLLILEAPYLSMQDLIAMKFPILPKGLVSVILKYPIRTDLWIQNVSGAIELFHGTADEVVPYKNSELLYQRIYPHNPSANLTMISEGSHNNLASYAIYQHRLNTLLGIRKL